MARTFYTQECLRNRANVLLVCNALQRRQRLQEDLSPVVYSGRGWRDRQDPIEDGLAGGRPFTSLCRQFSHSKEIPAQGPNLAGHRHCCRRRRSDVIVRRLLSPSAHCARERFDNERPNLNLVLRSALDMETAAARVRLLRFLARDEGRVRERDNRLWVSSESRAERPFGCVAANRRCWHGDCSDLVVSGA